MPQRSRQRVRRVITGGRLGTRNTITGVTSWTSIGVSNAWLETMTDWTQPPPFLTDQPLAKVDQIADPVRFSGDGPHTSPTTRWVFDGYVPSNFRSASDVTYPSIPSASYWLTRALANMNPNRPGISLPLFLFELRELPGMIRDLGNVLRRRPGLRDVPNAHLAYEFGWRPLVQDALSLFGLASSISERIKYLKRLESGGHIRRTLFDGETARSTQSNAIQLGSNALGYCITADIETVDKLKVWYTANAQLQTKLPDGDELQLLALKTQLGLTPTAIVSSVWGALPWSWLIDWFINIGDVMESTGGWIPWKCTRLNVMMTATRTQHLVSVKYVGNISKSGKGKTGIQRIRNVHSNPTPRLSLTPFLTDGQLAILGSLATASNIRAART